MKIDYYDLGFVLRVRQNQQNENVREIIMGIFLILQLCDILLTNNYSVIKTIVSCSPNKNLKLNTQDLYNA